MSSGANARPTDLDDYLFDLRGYLVLEHAIEPDLTDALNAEFDGFPDIPPLGWWGNVQRIDDDPHVTNLALDIQNIVEAGVAFERLIDHPSWIDYAHRYVGEQESYVQGLYIDECFATVRRAGGYSPPHSGGYRGAVRGQYRFKDGVFRCGQLNVLMALTDIGPGDGGTVVVPGSHKSNFPHPQFAQFGNENGGRIATMEGAVEVHLNAGDALLFVDGLSHGAGARTNPGERRVVIYRYGPTWGANRRGYHYSQALLDRLTPARRSILQPVPPRIPG
jgi:hypothetical protein